MVRVSKSLPYSWKRFCELEFGPELWWCSEQLLHVLSRLEVFNLWNSQGVWFWLLWGGGGWRVYYSLTAEVWIAFNTWIKNCVDDFSQEILENKWSLNSRGQKLIGFVCCVCSFWTLGILAGVQGFSFSNFRPFYSFQWLSIYRQRSCSLESATITC